MSRPKGTPNLEPEQIMMIIVLSRKGNTRPKIAEKVGCSVTTVYNYQKKYGLL